MFRAEFLSSLDLGIAQSLNKLSVLVLLYINDTQMALLCETMCGCDECSNYFIV